MKKTAPFSLALVLVVWLSAAAQPQSQSPPAPRSALLSEAQKATHVLNRIAFGPRPGDIERVRKMGVENYLEQQLYPGRIDDHIVDAQLEGFASLGMRSAELFERYPDQQAVIRILGIDRQNTEQAAIRQQVQAYMREQGLRPPPQIVQELAGQRLVRAVSSERQLQEELTDFWFNHFNVFFGKNADRYLTTEYEMKAIRPHVLGKFKDLLMATAKSSAMMVYLDNQSSVVPDPRVADAAAQRGNRGNRGNGAARKPGINENYARELMELHTLGVDGGYTQKDIQEVARAFTGWSAVANNPQTNVLDRTAARLENQAAPRGQRGARGARGGARPAPEARGAFTFRPLMHDTGEKVVLGHKIPAGGGIEDGEKVIDILAHHPGTARFIAAELVRRFVSDTPPEALVSRVAATYDKTDGDIREMLRVIFSSNEFFAPETMGAKTKSPLELAASAIRLLDGSTDGGVQLIQAVEKMGQPLYRYQAPTGFPDRADFWMSNGLILERINFAIALTANRIPGTRITLAGFDNAKAAALLLGSPEFQKR